MSKKTPPPPKPQQPKTVKQSQTPKAKPKNNPR